VVVGFGGYPSMPTVYAAAKAGIATVIHEQNAILGRANRMLAPRARAIATSFPIVELLGRTDEQRQVLTGNPVRPGIIAVREHGYTPPGSSEPFNLLITGGSQGARVFSRVVPAAVAGLPPAAQARLRIVQQARPEDIDKLRAAYQEAGVQADLATFFSDMPERLARAHLVIARAGASTIAELTAAGRPAILVPYPFATDDHQTANAFALATLGGAWTIADEEFTPATLTTHLASLLADPAPLARTAHEAMVNGKPDAAERLADVVKRFAGANGNSNKPVVQEEAA
jgi:UDP-N-acetylglucosamine--N-acetylmuramyl-(pentapeptide) pyrophosphoryl-undecaprenol N-acetylglucosamine transferase